MTTLLSFDRKSDRRLREEPSVLARLATAIVAGFADMGSLGLRKPRLRRRDRSDAAALAGDWRVTLSGLDRALKQAEHDGPARRSLTVRHQPTPPAEPKYGPVRSRLPRR